jgi:hypothetical protein
LLSDAIRKKGQNLKKITLDSTDVLNEEGVNFLKWENDLKVAPFQNLKTIETKNIPCNVEVSILKNSGKDILEINAQYSIEILDYPSENKNLIMTISRHCPKLTRLTIDVDPTNLFELSLILLNCVDLEKVHFTTRARIFPNGDKLLKIMSDSSPESLREFSFSEQWNLSIEYLETFLKNWKCKGRFPIKFAPYFDSFDCGWTPEHRNLLEEYKTKGVIKLGEYY